MAQALIVEHGSLVWEPENIAMKTPDGVDGDY